MGHEDHGLGRALPYAQELRLHQAAGLGVECAERLVHQQDFRIEGERARDRGALLHAAGQLRGIAVLEAVEADEIDERLRARLACVTRQPHSLETVKNVAAHRFPGKQREMLKHDATIRARRAHRLALDRDRAGLDREKAADQVQQRRLPAARWPEQGDEFAGTHIERDLLEREHRPSARRAVDVAHALDDDLRRCHATLRSRSSMNPQVPASSPPSMRSYRTMDGEAQQGYRTCRHACTLQPGDLILTGTPAGVGFARRSSCRPATW